MWCWWVRSNRMLQLFQFKWQSPESRLQLFSVDQINVAAYRLMASFYWDPLYSPAGQLAQSRAKHHLQLIQLLTGERYPLNYDTYKNPNFQHKIRKVKNGLKSSLSSFPCQLFLRMETDRKFIQAVADHFSSFRFEQGRSFRDCGPSFHVCPIPQSFVEGRTFTCGRLWSKNFDLRVRFAQLWSNLLFPIGQITSKLLLPLFRINFRLPVRGTVFAWNDANGCSTKAGDLIRPGVGCAEVAGESRWEEGGGGKEGRGGGRWGKAWGRRRKGGLLMVAASVISRRVAKVHKRLKRVDGVKGLRLEQIQLGCWKGFMLSKYFFSGDKEMQGGGVRVWGQYFWLRKEFNWGEMI